MYSDLWTLTLIVCVCVCVQFSVENYFVASQKTRPAIFGTPVVVPCDGSSQRAALYECVWGQVKRLMIPDPPNRTR